MGDKVSIDIPSGFEEISARGPFANLTGPFFRKVNSDNAPTATFGFMPEQQHMNGLGFMHGGMVCTLLDLFMAQAVSEQYKRRLVTTNMQIEFLKTLPADHWIEATVSIAEVDARNVRAHASLLSRGSKCASGNASFRLFRR